MTEYSIEEMFAELHRIWDERPDPFEMFDRIRAERLEMERQQRDEADT